MTERPSLARALALMLVTGAGLARAAEPSASAPAAAPSAAAPVPPTSAPPSEPGPPAATPPNPPPAAAPEPAPASEASQADAAPPSVMFEAQQTGPQGPRPPRDTNQIDDGKLGTHQEHWLVGMGLRESFVTHRGFDLFSSNNALPQFSLSAGRTLLVSGQLSLAALLGWDWGTVEDHARGEPTSLTVNRLTLGAEGRYHVWRRFYAFGRVAPGALHSAATIHDAVAGVDSASSDWLFATDLSLGAALEFAGDNRGASSRPRGWIGAEGGYGWAQASKLSFRPDSGATPGAAPPVRLEPLNLGELAVRGAFLRLTATLTY
jgi:hypothetical protein